MKNITLSADEHHIDAARQRARSEHTTLNDAFRRWLADYALLQQRLRLCDDVVEWLQGRLRVGRHVGRDEMNAR